MNPTFAYILYGGDKHDLDDVFYNRATNESQNRGRPTDPHLQGVAMTTQDTEFYAVGGPCTSSRSFARCPVLDKNQVSVSLGRRIAQTSDGWIAIAADSATHVSELLGSFEATNADDLMTSLRSRTSHDVLAILDQAGVPSGPLNLKQKAAFFDDPDNIAAGLVANYPHPLWGNFEQTGALWFFGDLNMKHVLAPPTLGQHTVEILSELGLSEGHITSLIDRGIAVAVGAARKP